MLVLALLPLLALRAPAWFAQGGWPYFADASLWGPDLSWLLLFIGIYLSLGLYQVRRRRQILQRALNLLKTRADQARQRHHQALDHTFRYQHLIVAMRRLVLLEEQIERVRVELQAALIDVSRLETMLIQQCAYYAHQAPAPELSPDAMLPRLLDTLWEHPPRDWLRCMLRDWPSASPETIEVRDTAFGQAGTLHTTYLRGCTRLNFIVSL